MASSSYLHFPLKLHPFLTNTVWFLQMFLFIIYRGLLDDCWQDSANFFVSEKRESDAGHHLCKPHQSARVLAAAKSAKPVLCHACFTFWPKKAPFVSCRETFHSSFPLFIKYGYLFNVSLN